jgi:hypothetical protein
MLNIMILEKKLIIRYIPTNLNYFIYFCSTITHTTGIELSRFLAEGSTGNRAKQSCTSL